VALNLQSGNMYDFITHTWNPIKGKCSHTCSYCYMHQERLKALRLDEKDLQTDLGESNVIFVGSSTDMWAKDVPEEWIRAVIERCDPADNRFLFQSKNPRRLLSMPNNANFIFGTTIETNRDYKISQAPIALLRAGTMKALRESGSEVMVTIEPIMDFDLVAFSMLIEDIRPSWVNIGADSKGHKLPEPSWEKVQNLIKILKTFTGVREKKNIGRLKRGVINHQTEGV